MRTMDPKDALNLMRLAGEVWAGKRSLPPDILAKKREVLRARRMAEAFWIRFRVVDHGLVYQAASLMHDLDALYAAWAERERS
jgi:hypothetical protein